MTEIGCHNCYGACCMGPTTMQLTLLEKAQMEGAGTLFQTVADPVSYDRTDVLYPLGIQINQERGTFNWLGNPDRPFEPLPAGYGRYMLLGACGNLKADGSCGIYEQRPAVCRDFEEGGAKCQLMRETRVEIGRKLFPRLFG